LDLPKGFFEPLWLADQKVTFSRYFLPFAGPSAAMKVNVKGKLNT